MSKQMIHLEHHLDDYECMWNGIEDLYIRETKESLPPNFFFVLAGFGSFCYIKTPKDDLKRMIALGDGRTKKMYEFLAPIVGFDYKYYEYKTFEQALKKSKVEIDAGYPIVLGALDMYYLPYFTKLYHVDHIPFHYVMMVGYDDETQCIYFHDCGRKEIQQLSYEELRNAWNCSYPGLSKPNTVCTIRIKSLKNKYEIAKDAFAKKADAFLHPQVGFVGIKGMDKFIAELPKLKTELPKNEYDKIFANMVTFLGTVPKAPNKLLGIDEPDETYGGGFDKMSCVLTELGTHSKDRYWIEAAAIFQQGVPVINEIKNIIVDYLVNEDNRMNQLPDLFRSVRDIMADGFQILYKGIEK